MSKIQKIILPDTVGDIKSSEKRVSKRYREGLEDEHIKALRQDREQRKKFAEDVFTVIVIYIAVVMFILIAYGLSMLYFSDAVLITLLSTTTANILSLLVIVFNYLFPKK